jgi:hypothetical protein
VQSWLRSLVNAVLGKVPGKTSRLDTATRMAVDADFSYRREPTSGARRKFDQTAEPKRILKERK